MRLTRLVRTVTLVALMIAILAPAAVQAAPRHTADRDGQPSLLIRAVDWVRNLWGAGGGSFEPSGLTDPPPPTAPEPAPAPAPATTEPEMESVRGNWGLDLR